MLSGVMKRKRDSRRHVQDPLREFVHVIHYEQQDQPENDERSEKELSESLTVLSLRC